MCCDHVFRSITNLIVGSSSSPGHSPAQACAHIIEPTRKRTDMPRDARGDSDGPPTGRKWRRRRCQRLANRPTDKRLKVKQWGQRSAQPLFTSHQQATHRNFPGPTRLLACRGGGIEKSHARGGEGRSRYAHPVRVFGRLGPDQVGGSFFLRVPRNITKSW